MHIQVQIYRHAHVMTKQTCCAFFPTLAVAPHLPHKSLERMSTLWSLNRLGAAYILYTCSYIFCVHSRCISVSCKLGSCVHHLHRDTIRLHEGVQHCGCNRRTYLVRSVQTQDPSEAEHRVCIHATKRVCVLRLSIAIIFSSGQGWASSMHCGIFIAHERNKATTAERHLTIWQQTNWSAPA